MKNFDLATCGVVEMNEFEMMEIDGGGAVAVVVIAGILLFACAMAAY